MWLIPDRAHRTDYPALIGFCAATELTPVAIAI
jgi:hypothetical protein